MWAALRSLHNLSHMDRCGAAQSRYFCSCGSQTDGHLAGPAEEMQHSDKISNADSSVCRLVWSHNSIGDTAQNFSMSILRIEILSSDQGNTKTQKCTIVNPANRDSEAWFRTHHAPLWPYRLDFFLQSYANSFLAVAPHKSGKKAENDIPQYV